VIYPAEESSRAVFKEAFAFGPLSRMPAVRTGKVIPIDGDLLTRPGPRAFDALEQIAGALEKLSP
jgi:ABC-type Fe3+-hydroxamate transport system substrate-binding protein